MQDSLRFLMINQEKANIYYDNGIKIESYPHFSDWISHIHQLEGLVESV